MWLWFVEQGWLYCMLIMGIVLTVQLIVHWKDWDILRKLGAFTVIVLVFHVWEEWVIPGGFHYYYNMSSDAALRDRYPMNELTDMITNFGGALIWFILVQTNKYERKMSFAVMSFGYAEVAIHLLGAASSRTLLLESGIYSPFYGPGMLTALVCWLPLAIAYTVYFVKNCIKKWDIIGGAIILVVLSMLLITMPESLLKSEDTPYVYDNAGWYEQYIDNSGAIIEQG
ncbi:MAG: HXXEE domain-containing protein [Oscillospiraceae bacterium]